MININVPQDTPFTHQNNGVEVVAVINAEDNEVCGIYPNFERAMKYVRDWLSDLKKDGSIRDVYFVASGDRKQVVVDGEVSYFLQKTYFRI